LNGPRRSNHQYSDTEQGYAKVRKPFQMQNFTETALMNDDPLKIGIQALSPIISTATLSALFSLLFTYLFDKQRMKTQAAFDQSKHVGARQYDNEYKAYQEIWIELMELRHTGALIQNVHDMATHDEKNTFMPDAWGKYVRRSADAALVLAKQQPFISPLVFTHVAKLIENLDMQSFCLSAPHNPRLVTLDKTKLPDVIQLLKLVDEQIQACANAIQQRISTVEIIEPRQS